MAITNAKPHFRAKNKKSPNLAIGTCVTTFRGRDAEDGVIQVDKLLGSGGNSGDEDESYGD